MKYKKFSSKQRKEIEELLVKFGASVKDIAPTTKEGRMDVEGLQKMSETKTLIEALKTLGVENRNHLSQEGFVVASMIIEF